MSAIVKSERLADNIPNSQPPLSLKSVIRDLTGLDKILLSNKEAEDLKKKLKITEDENAKLKIANSKLSVDYHVMKEKNESNEDSFSKKVKENLRLKEEIDDLKNSIQRESNAEASTISTPPLLLPPPLVPVEYEPPSAFVEEIGILDAIVVEDSDSDSESQSSEPPEGYIVQNSAPSTSSAANTSGAENTSSRKLTPNRRIAKSLARPTKTKKARTDARNNIEKLNSDHMK